MNRHCSSPKKKNFELHLFEEHDFDESPIVELKKEKNFGPGLFVCEHDFDESLNVRTEKESTSELFCLGEHDFDICHCSNPKEKFLTLLSVNTILMNHIARN
ncbi:hypothetical protein AVEN_172065-1 [Araneus ventricosus]|uniref:Uncharacterized protein n=1 Tax=Araneus ventricosus TaxID=182803 RepID=A0A4Y2PNA2_ARAVE|nr:hypothetical protein AVEN_172065-1 [Araneus ventricosus]